MRTTKATEQELIHICAVQACGVRSTQWGFSSMLCTCLTYSLCLSDYSCLWLHKQSETAGIAKGTAQS